MRKLEIYTSGSKIEVMLALNLKKTLIFSLHRLLEKCSHATGVGKEGGHEPSFDFFRKVTRTKSQIETDLLAVVALHALGTPGSAWEKETEANSAKALAERVASLLERFLFFFLNQ